MSEKILTLQQACSKCSQLKQKGRRIVLANGCFDLIHVGHVRYLEAARAAGDILIVAVNSDESVRKLKGPGRPLIPERGRAEMIAAFDCVDYVIVFSEQTLETVLLALKPDVHAKGTDYTEESVPEREVVRSFGGTTAIVGDPKDHSSRDLIRKILENSKDASA
ncbi:MAG TPA: adenylyltransferase/cytidyltransferase family protein [Acidobacteriota bacterium]